MICGMQDMGCRTWDAGQVGYKTRGMYDRKDAGKEGCRDERKMG